MSFFLASMVVPMLLGCDSPGPVSQQKVLLLPDGQVRVDGVAGDLSGALDRLGPAGTTRIVVAGCPNSPFSTV